MLNVSLKKTPKAVAFHSEADKNALTDVRSTLTAAQAAGNTKQSLDEVELIGGNSTIWAVVDQIKSDRRL
jgi:hypothetical protein